MQRTLLTLALIAAAVPAAAQVAPPVQQPLIVTGKTATAIRDGAARNDSLRLAAMPSRPTAQIKSAQQTIGEIESVCDLVEHDGTLFAACDNTTPTGRDKLPLQATEWGPFAARLATADAVAYGKPRPVVVLNGAVTMAEVSASGIVTLKK